MSSFVQLVHSVVQTKRHGLFLSAKVRNAQECQDRCTVDNSCECVVWVLDGTQRLDPGLQISGVAEECPPKSTPETIRTTSDLLKDSSEAILRLRVTVEAAIPTI